LADSLKRAEREAQCAAVPELVISQ